MTTFNESKYGKRRCELYNINLNSRYKYQYICSYNASEDFQGDKKKDGFDKIECVLKINNIEGNDIINKFYKVFGSHDNDEEDYFIAVKLMNLKRMNILKMNIAIKKIIFIIQ